MTRRTKSYFETPEGAPLPVSAEAKHKIQFNEVDPMGIVWHGNYPYFFQLAWTELSGKTGLTPERFAEEKITVPIAQIHIDYHKPLLLDDEILIRCSQVWCEGAKMQMEYRIFLPDGALASTGYSIQLFYDIRTREPLFLAPAVLESMRERWKNGAFA